MSARFDGQVVMITGAAGGFGAAAARQFGQNGARLVLSDRDATSLADLAQELTGSSIDVVANPIDVTSEVDISEHVRGATQTFGKVDVAVNNAGIGQSLARLQDLSTEEFDRVMAVNARGVFLCMKHQLPGMMKRRSGTILNVASAAGLVGAGRLSAYAASKHAVVGLTRSAADEVATFGIRVNALCPSFAPTPLFEKMASEIAERNDGDRDDAQRRITSRIPMRRLATVDEVVQAMVWICDPVNSFLTGQTIAIDGGLTAI